MQWHLYRGSVEMRTVLQKKNGMTYDITFYYDDGMVERINDVVEIINTRQRMFGGGSRECYDCETIKGCVSASSEGLEKIIASPNNDTDMEIELER